MLSRLLGGTSAGDFVYVGGTTSAGTGSSSTVSMTSLSGGIASQPSAGDLVIVGAGFENSTNRNIVMSTSGYTEVADLYANSREDSQLGVYYKRLATSETQFTVTSSAFSVGWRIVVQVWRYSNPLDPFDTFATAVVTNTGVPDAPTITTSVDNALVIVVAHAAHEDTPAPLTAPPGTENFLLAGSGSRSQTGMASIIRETAGAYDPPAFGGGETDTDSSFCAVTLAFKPE